MYSLRILITAFCIGVGVRQTDATRFIVTAFVFLNGHAVNIGFVFYENAFFFVVLVSGGGDVIFPVVAAFLLNRIKYQQADNAYCENYCNRTTKLFSLLNESANSTGYTAVENVVDKFNDGISLAGDDAPEVPKRNLI